MKFFDIRKHFKYRINHETLISKGCINVLKIE